MKKIYVVCEHYTAAFCGVFSTWFKAQEEANEIGGFVVEYVLGKDGEWHEVEEEA